MWWVDAVATVGAAAEPDRTLVVGGLGRRRFGRWPCCSRRETDAPMSVHLLVGDDESILRAAVSDLVHELVGDDDRSLVVDEFDGDDVEIGSIVDAAQTPAVPHRSARRAGS